MHKTTIKASTYALYRRHLDKHIIPTLGHIQLQSFVVDSLLEYRKHQLKLRVRSSRWQDKDLVFSTARGGYVAPQYVYDALKALLKEAGLPDMRFHDLRHSAISIWLAMGINPKVIQELAGHSDIRITMNVYGHVFPGMHGQAMDDFDRKFRAVTEE